MSRAKNFSRYPSIQREPAKLKTLGELRIRSSAETAHVRPFLRYTLSILSLPPLPCSPLIHRFLISGNFCIHGRWEVSDCAITRMTNELQDI